ncbi:MAG TPA: acyltransferase, partial [Acidobacteriaceae bacterium]|nr:acyltransferase [Acidobacteriaceae bacterium]
VDGFFIISGYLVTKSFLQDPSVFSYLGKRALRIYPGFLVGFWLCVLLVAPFVSGSTRILSVSTLLQEFPNSIGLQEPLVKGVFPGMAYPSLDSPMWTIGFEFKCYILTMCLGLAGMYARKRRAFTLVAMVALLGINAFDPIPHGLHWNSMVRFAAIFGVGILYYIYRDKVRFTHRGALISALILVLLLFSKRWAETSLAIFGGYLIFWIAFKLPVFRLSKLANKTDLSYGIYLYAWPIASILAWNFRQINPWLLSAITFAGAAAVAYFSWTLVEKPCLALIKKGTTAPTHLDPVLALKPEVEDVTTA